MMYFLRLVRSLDDYYYLLSLLIVAATFFVLRWAHADRNRQMTGALLTGYLFLVLAVTVLSRKHVKWDSNILPLFWKYRQIVQDSPKSYKLTIEIILNTLLFVPAGFLFPLTVKKNAILYGFLCSVSIEVLQLVTGRGFFEVDDLIHNTFGVVIGYCLYKGKEKVKKRRR